MLRLNILDHFVQGCNRETATYEFIGMLAVFALLGFVLRHVLSNSGNKLQKLEEENLNLKLNLSNLEEEVHHLQLTNAVLEKKLRDQEYYSRQVEESPAIQMVSAPEKEEEKTNTIQSIERSAEENAVTQHPDFNTNNQEEELSSVLESNVTSYDSAEEERKKEEEHQERIRMERERILREMEEERIQEQEETRRKLKLLLEGEATNETEIKHAEEKEEVNTQESANELNDQDDLKVIEGVGPAIERILTAAGILTYKQLSTYTGSQIHEILSQAGPRFKVHDPTTWPEQAKLLSEGKMEEFKLFTSQLIAGKKRQD